MIVLRDKEDGREIGAISEAQLKMLVDAFEEESSRDQDYYVDGATLDYLAEQTPGSEDLVALLRGALGAREGMDIAWQRR